MLFTENKNPNNDAATRARVLNVVQKLAAELAARPPSRVAGLGFWSGQAGSALTLACLSQLPLSNSAAYAAAARQQILAVTDGMAQFTARQMLSHTWSLWATRSVASKLPLGDISGKNSDNTAASELLATCDEYDEWLLQACDDGELGDLSDFSFDVIDGWSAFLAYAMASWHDAQASARPSDISAALAQRALQGLLDMAQQSTAPESEIVHWHWHSHYPFCRSHSMQANPYGYFDYGVAHGNFGVAAALALCQHSPLAEQAEPAMRGLLAWLRSQQNPASCASLYSYGSANPHAESRCAWCYGDAGISWILANLGRQYTDHTYLRDGLQAAHLCAQRPPERRGIVDAGLCHGHAGLGHILSRHLHAAPDANHDVLTHCASGHMLAALTILEEGSEAEIGYLEGRSGIALALASHYLGLDNSWDFPLLFSLPSLFKEET